MNDSPLLYSPASAASLSAKPGRTLLTSEDAGWRSLLLRTIELPGHVEEFEALPSPDHLVTMVKSGVYSIESSSARSARRTQYRPGRGGLTAAMNTSRLRWSSDSHERIQSIQVFLPAIFVEQAIEEFRRPGSKTPHRFPDTLSFNDPVVTAIVRSLAEEVKHGATDLVADSAARYLITRLLLSHETIESSSHLRRSGVLKDKRLIRVLSFMQETLASAIGLEELASEAAMSPFHFSRVFKAAVGVPPAAYLIQLRMERAERLLVNKDMPIADIAKQCGYTQSGYFAAAFRKRFRSTPGEYRSRHVGNRADTNQAECSLKRALPSARQ